MIVDVIKKCWAKQKERKFFESYVATDLHGTIILPNHKFRGNTEVIFYPFAKEVMKILSQRYDTRTICYTSSYPEELEGVFKTV